MIRLYLIHEQRFYRDHLIKAFKEDDSFCLIGFSKNANQAIRRRHTHTADLVLFEIGVSDWTEGLERLCASLRRTELQTPVVALGTKSDVEVIRAIAAGAYGAIPAEASALQMQRTLKALHRRRPLYSAALAGNLLGEIRRRASKLGELGERPPLTPRQQEVLDLLHLTNEEIAEALNLEVSTVKTHIHAVLLRAGARDRRHVLELAKRWVAN